ncbi:hypothetical protein Pcinc_037994 [Petrolisthes cinctipes]|uniref:TBC1 domain family member 2B n=1 Tax=Petrolisthes cinctipes TaxID=88211 RepID=A0AAE1BRH9_PETCI|nr:hypothetical protein Pcinc_037994 [Petrolisthes cinctipes]
MFYQPLIPSSTLKPEEEEEKIKKEDEIKEEEDEKKEDEIMVIQRRPRANSDSLGKKKNNITARPKTWTTKDHHDSSSSSLEKIEETTSENDAKRNYNNSSPLTEYRLAGYMYKISLTSTNKRHVPSLISMGLGSSPKKRWFVFSDSVCKLYYYKQKNDSEPLGMVDISLATFFFDPENTNEGQFTIRYGTSEMVLDAMSTQNRLHWLQELQTARREFSQRRTTSKSSASRTTSTERPKSGLLQDVSIPVPVPDPHHDLVMPAPRHTDQAKMALPPRPPQSLLDARLALSNLLPGTQRKIFKNISNSESPRSPTSPQSARHSPLGSPAEDITLGSIGRKLRSSLRGKRSSSLEGKEGFEIPNTHCKVTCKRCEELRSELVRAKEDLTATQDEYQASREVIDVLQKELSATHEEKATLISLDRSDLTDNHVLEILRAKDRQIVNLEHDNQELTNELACLREEVAKAHSHNNHLSDKLSMLYSLIEAKNDAIVTLTHQVDDYKSGNDGGTHTSLPTFTTTDYTTKATQTLPSEDEALKDALEAYRCQNIFLNKEILELNLLRKHASEREERLITESSEWEAKFYQIQSKYLLLLNELHSPRATQDDRSIVTRLLQDVVEAHGPPDLRGIQKKGREYDEYGFCVTAPEDSTLSSKAEYIQKQSQALAHQAQQSGSSWESKWESFLAGTSAKELPHCTDLKYLIRGGIPYQYKGKVWRLLIDAQVAPLKAAVPSNYYQDLLSRWTTSSTLDPAAKQIELDLLRTLPNNRHYEDFHSDGIAKLRRVLLAFSRHNLPVGYCQGLNRLAAIALLFLNEEDAFWCLVYIVEYLMPPDYYSKNLLGSQVDQRVLKDLVCEKLPRLHAHLDQHGLDISLFTFNWFLCVYIDVIPPITYLTIWDSFLYEGSKVLFRYSLAIFKVCEERILEKCDYMEIFNYLRSIPEPVTNIAQLEEVIHKVTSWALSQYCN